MPKTKQASSAQDHRARSNELIHGQIRSVAMGSCGTEDKWDRCGRCGWWVQVDNKEPEYVLYHIDISPTVDVIILFSNWCEEANTWDLGSREHFRECCGPKGFGPDDWFSCTRCNKWRYVGEYVPENYMLNFVIRSDMCELLCDQCKVRKSVWVPIENPWLGLA